MNGMHNRRSIRLPGYDYTQPGAYFITLVTQNRLPLFGEVRGGEVRLSLAGQIVRSEWLALFTRFPWVEPDEFVIMPNHLHGVLRWGEPDGSRWGEASAANLVSAPAFMTADASPLPNGTARGSLGAMVQNIKSVSTRKIHALRGTPGARVWQRNYYEHILRTDADLDNVRAYIRANPLQWETDRENPERKDK